MNVVYGLLLGAWVMVLGARGDPKQAGVVAPLQVAGVVAGVTVLTAGTAVLVAYGIYGWLGQSMAASDACGNVHVGKGRVAKTEPAPTEKPAQPVTVPTPDQLKQPDESAPSATEVAPVVQP